MHFTSIYCLLPFSSKFEETVEIFSCCLFFICKFFILNNKPCSNQHKHTLSIKKIHTYILTYKTLSAIQQGVLVVFLKN